jgi:acetyl esterase/lipase
VTGPEIAPPVLVRKSRPSFAVPKVAATLAAAGVDVRLRRLNGAFHLLWLATRITPAAQAEVIDVIAERLTGA